jgi:hypothetical protein
MTVNSFQIRAYRWAVQCFGLKDATDKQVRTHRFLEEALELAQACGCTADDAHQLVDYTFGRPVGDIDQEVGGTMVTLAILCAVMNSREFLQAGEAELNRCWEKIEKIRAKQLAKPKFSPLPE